MDLAKYRFRSSRADVLVLALVLLLGAGIGDLLLYSSTQEDAFITFRYSRHLAEGHGVGAWNRGGDPVEGYTPTLWMLWLAAAPLLGASIQTWSKVSGIAAQLALCGFLFAYPSLRRPEYSEPDAVLCADADVFRFAAVLLALYLPMSWYATSGMETTAFALLVALAWLLPACTASALPIAGVYAAIVLMRPEGALVGGVFGLWHGLRSWRASGRPGAGLPALIAVAATFIALTAFRWAWFGELLPNTFFAKAAGAGELGWRLGGRYLQGFGAHHMAWCTAVAVAALGSLVMLRRRGFEVWGGAAFGFGLLAVYAGYVWRVGGDNPTAFPYWRHALHVAPIFAVAVGAGLVSLARRRALRIALLVLVVGVTHIEILGAHQHRLARELQAAAARFPSLHHTKPNPYYLWIAELSTPDSRVASPAAGELPFVVDAFHIDMLGLNDAHIAHHGSFDPDGPIDSKTDVASVLDRRPDLIQSTLRSARFTTGSPRGNRILHRGAMEAALLNHPRFRGEYLFVANAPYEARDRALFIHRDFWTEHPRRDEILVVPVTETAIYGGTGRPSLR